MHFVYWLLNGFIIRMNLEVLSLLDLDLKPGFQNIDVSITELFRHSYLQGLPNSCQIKACDLKFEHIEQIKFEDKLIHDSKNLRFMYLLRDRESYRILIVDFIT